MDILVIEDERKVAELLRRGLEEQGYQVTLAQDGEMGKHLDLSGDYYLIITDINLPKNNGIYLGRMVYQVFSSLVVASFTNRSMHHFRKSPFA